MTMIDRNEGAVLEITGDGMSLKQLAEIINYEHEQCTRAAKTTISHAIQAGRALLCVRAEKVPTGQWLEWLTENFNGNKKTAYTYLRLAMYADHLPSGLGIRAAERLLDSRGLKLGEARPRVPDALREDAARLRQSGWSYKQIAAEYDLSVSTVHNWFNDTRKRRQRQANAALQREEQERATRAAVRKAGAALAEAYSLAERMDQVLGQAHREAADREVRRDLALAGESYRAMRDFIVSALGRL